MPLITAVGLGKSYGPNDIFSNVSLSIPHGARMALVGANGIGKTTLLRLLVGEEEASSGVVHRARGLRTGYLPQESLIISNDTLWSECLTAFADLVDMQAELGQLETMMSNPQHAQEALQAYGARQQLFDKKGGYTYETRIRQTLAGLGFTPADYNRPLTQLSGGQRTRALLARLLLSEPDLLLLDEPTNHLDIQAVEWLEDYFKDWPGAILVVSHDRYFLDRVATTILEMTPAIELYHGNYSTYLAQRGERYRRRLEEYQSQAEFVEKEEDFIRRNIAGQNTRQAQGRRKRLERLLEEVHLTPPRLSRKLHLALKPVSRSGDLVVRTYNLQIGYHDEGRPLFAAPDLTLVRSECAAVIGPNGAGKTTFLKTLLGQLPPFSGEVALGASLNIGYFAQAHEGLHPDCSLVDEIASVAPEMQPPEIRTYLARFLFTGDDVFQPVETLSGGERGRLALAKLALSGANLLLLDEPTNHLDLPSQEILQSVLGDYPGTILLVSHDRYLIDALATQIWEVDPQQASLRVFQGTYSEYHLARQAEAAQPDNLHPAPGKKLEAPRSHQPSKTSNLERKRQQQLQELEDEITRLEEQLAGVSRQLENPPPDAGKVLKLGQDYTHLQQELEARFNDWEVMQT
jgi:ATP-binding cassette subfamily F protein 3